MMPILQLADKLGALVEANTEQQDAYAQDAAIPPPPSAMTRYVPAHRGYNS